MVFRINNIKNNNNNILYFPLSPEIVKQGNVQVILKQQDRYIQNTSFNKEQQHSLGLFANLQDIVLIED